MTQKHLTLFNYGATITTRSINAEDREMVITAQTHNARVVMAAYRKYLSFGYGLRLARKIARIMVSDARSGKYLDGRDY